MIFCRRKLALLLLGMTLLSALCSRLAAAPGPGDERWDFRFGRVGLDNPPTAFTWHEGQLHLGGPFYTAGHAVANGVARWDGTNFWPLGGGLGRAWTVNASEYGSVSSLASFGGRLFAGGDFFLGQTNVLHGLAAWDGTNWNSFGSVTGHVAALTVENAALYIAGVFGFIGDTNRYAVARWDGAAWETFDSVVEACFHCGEASVHALAVRGEEIHLLGAFNYLAGLPINGLARFSGGQWDQFPLNVSGDLRDVKFHGGELFVAGQFFAIGADNVTNVARWSGSNWLAVGESLGSATWPLEGVDDEPVDRLHSDGDALYAIGEFTRSGLTAMNGVARWSGGAWEALGTNILSGNNWRSAITVGPDGSVYLGGYFESVQGRPAGHIAAWNGEHWQPLGPDTVRGLSGSISFAWAFATHGPDIYAGGIFGNAGTLRAPRLARFTPAGVTNVGGGFTNFSDRVLALAVVGSNLFAGGRFTNAGGVAANCLARWDGAAWSGFGGAIQSNVLALATDGARLFVGGQFTLAQGSVANRVAAWDGTNWSSLGGGMDHSVAALVWADGFLYAGGSFTNAGGVAASRIARWDGNVWQALGGGIIGTNARVNALAVSGSNVFAGGQRFAMAGDRAVTNLAQWNGTAWQPLGNLDSNGVNGTVFALATLGGDLFVGGSFTLAGDVPANALARWDGTNWFTLGSGLGYAQTVSPLLPRVLALLPHDGALYAGGAFTTAGGHPAYGLARWMHTPAARMDSIQPSVAGTALHFSGVAGLRYALERSPDLQNWSEVFSERSFTPDNIILLPPSLSTNNANFHRLRLVP